MLHIILRRAKPIAGTILIGLGIVILYKNLGQLAMQLGYLLTSTGILPRVLLAAVRVLQAYASDHQRFLEGLFQQAFITLWPLLLVIAGTALSGDAFSNPGEALAKKDQQLVDLTVRRSTFK